MEQGEEDSVRLWDCLGKVGLEELAGGLKEREYTHISRLFSEDGVELSGGEGQRLGIARAVYKDAQILVLDEPAANLDVKMEEELYRNFYGYTQGKISLTVSHRLSQATVCNKIFVLNQGFICEEGNHGTLMEKDGIYAAMFRKQREAYGD
jgi:ABC-type multidrug transport system fused ATPase/permease subunit